MHRVYLDELGDIRQLPLWVALMVLTTLEQSQAPEEAKYLLTRMLIYKFVNKSQQELQAMFGLTDWRQTKFYQEVKEETKLDTIPRLLKFGLSIEQIAEALELDVKQVRQAIENQGEEGTTSNS